MNFALPVFLTAVATAVLPSTTFATSVSFDLSKTGSTLRPRQLAGTCLPIWNGASTYDQIRTGLVQAGYRLFRFPNGSLSNGYHWNGKGSYTDDSVWVCDSETFEPGFMSMTLRRGTSVSNWGFNCPSDITDGDTATWWRSDELIAESSPYCYLELSTASAVDSIVIYWGERYAVDFNVEFFTETNPPYPGPFGNPDDLWITEKSVIGNDQPCTSFGLSDSVPVRHVRILVNN